MLLKIQMITVKRGNFVQKRGIFVHLKMLKKSYKPFFLKNYLKNFIHLMVLRLFNCQKSHFIFYHSLL